jgi:hypothetical protein
MAKKFNITGICFPNEHYMADISMKLASTLAMVEEGDYFIINRPRQYGKTTMLYTVADVLRKSGDYIVLNTSFEGVGDTFFSTEELFCQKLLKDWELYTKSRNPEWSKWLLAQTSKIETFQDLSSIITELVNKSDKEVVLLIDEVDKSSNNQLFINFLAMLRSKFLQRSDFKTFHSVVLAGVHDVKSLKLKLRPQEEEKLNSPWNIAAEYNIDMALQVNEIVPMLEEYAKDKNVQLDAQEIAECLFFHTSGYPFLVSKLCKLFDETFLPQKSERTWTTEDVEIAISKLLIQDNTNFDNITKNLENNPDLRQLVFNVMMFGRDFSGYNFQDPLIKLGILHGILRNGEILRIHNRIYETLIVNYMTSVMQHRDIDFRGANFAGKYLLRNNELDMNAVLTEFQIFMKEEYSRHDRDFLERNGRMVFLAFLKPILNGKGWFFKEPQISEERRLDIIITFYQRKYLIELKIWRGEKAHKKGIEQLSDYLEKQHLNQGYLIVFDHSAVKTWDKKRIRKADKKILAIWV